MLNRMVEVHWLDAAFMLDEESDEMETWKQHGGARAKTIGYMVEDRPNCVIVANEVFEDGTKRGFTVIPRGMISFIKELQWIG